MKLICIDTDQCGFFSKIQDLEVENHNNVCPECFGLAIEISEEHYPLLYEIDDQAQGDDEKILVILAAYYNIINQSLLNKEDNED